MALNVPPVTGMTPAKVATELRILIRDQLWFQAKALNTKVGKVSQPIRYKNEIIAMLSAQRAHISELDSHLEVLYESAKLRKPSVIREQVNTARLVLNSVRHRNSDIEGCVSASKPVSYSQELVVGVNNLTALCERAYALVQALPTIENPAVGREANTIRAITAILKVYYGVDVTGTVEKLPEMMPALLEAIKKPQDPPPPPSPAPPPVKEGWSAMAMLPWRVTTIHEHALGESPFEPLKGLVNLMPHGWHPPGTPPTSTAAHWNNGMCSDLDALKTLLALRLNYSDEKFSLVDANNIVFAVAEMEKKLKLFHGFSDVLYHLRKEYKGNAKSQGAQSPVSAPVPF